MSSERADWELQRDEAKAAGDAAFRAKNYAAAIESYTTALSVDPDNAKILSNRSATYLLNNDKSKALYDAQKCVEIGTMGNKGISRLAAALQALGRWEAAKEQWKMILKQEPEHVAAMKGFATCETQNAKKKEQDQKEEQKQQNQKEGDDGAGDDLDDFFNDVEEATEAVAKEKQDEAKVEATNPIKQHKKELGTADQQIERLLAANYKWRNLNPFYVLDIHHTATEDDISRRYKALSLLLHPDKNQENPRAQDAFDEVLKAKAKLDDENKASHVRQLIEQGLKQGKVDYETAELQQKQQQSNISSLEEFQSKAVQRIFAQVEYKRQEVEERQRRYEQRERQNEEEELNKERESRKFDKSWKQEERVDKRIGNWRDFQKKKKAKPV